MVVVVVLLVVVLVASVVDVPAVVVVVEVTGAEVDVEVATLVLGLVVDVVSVEVDAAESPDVQAATRATITTRASAVLLRLPGMNTRSTYPRSVVCETEPTITQVIRPLGHWVGTPQT